jgi:hypothetical protein
MALPTKPTRICYQFHEPSKIFHHSSQQNFTCGTTQFHVIGPFNSSNFMNFSNWFQYKCGPHWSWKFHLEQNLPFTFQGWIAITHSAHRYNHINDALGSRIIHSILNENIHDVFFLKNKVINFMKLIITYNEIGQNCC